MGRISVGTLGGISVTERASVLKNGVLYAGTRETNAAGGMTIVSLCNNLRCATSTK
jgi:hypothetical protein